jgi:hypothetical protein
VSAPVLPRQTRSPCTVHKRHSPRSHINEIHHVWPRGDGGPDTAANKVTICATGHNNVHDLINRYRKSPDGTVAWEIRRTYSPGERQLAMVGWRRISQQHM